uniref:Uncharacterized protein n=1 Tax=Syphacia muris TaxID=451379 RepID=A0A0N5AED3_9BILA
MQRGLMISLFQANTNNSLSLVAADPVPRPGSTQTKIDVNAEPPWDPDPLIVPFYTQGLFERIGRIFQPFFNILSTDLYQKASSFSLCLSISSEALSRCTTLLELQSFLVRFRRPP